MKAAKSDGTMKAAETGRAAGTVGPAATVSPAGRGRSTGRTGVARAVLCLFVLALFSAHGVTAQEIDVRLEVESRDVYVGEFFLVQIIVDGSATAEPPDLSTLDGFAVEYLGGQNNSSQSITIINGRMQRVVNRSYVFSYRLTPTRTGRLTIGALKVNVEGKTFQTEPVSIAVRQPTDSEDFKLRMHLSRGSCYVGEPVVLTVTWYLRSDVQDFRFSVPILQSDAFVFEDTDVKIDSRKQYYRIPLTGGEVIAEKGRDMLEGQSYATLTFSKVLIARRSGVFVIPEATVACEAIIESRRRRDFFDDFFSNDFFGLNRGKLKKYVVGSNSLSLQVTDLPLEGRPPGFSGHVGEYRISTTAEPTEVNVGDPITLRITLEGPDYLGSIDLPPLSEQPALTRDFRLPEERADGRIEGKRKVFTQTIRAVDETVREIPAITLDYFDTGKGRFMTASSDPIPIVVHPTRIVTASDAEGVEAGRSGVSLETWKEGIAYNYEGADLLASQDVGFGSLVKSPAWLTVLIAPPALFFTLLAGIMFVKQRQADPQARRARGALRRLRQRLEAIERSGGQSQLYGAVMEAFRAYLGDRLQCTGSTLTTGDVERLLASLSVDRAVADEVAAVLASCETGAYAGDVASAQDRATIIGRVMKAARNLERHV